MKKIFSLLLAVALVVLMGAGLTATPAQALSDTGASAWYGFGMDMTATNRGLPVRVEPFSVAYSSKLGRYVCSTGSLVLVEFGDCYYNAAVQSVSKSGGQTTVKLKIFNLKYEIDYNGTKNTGTFSPVITIRFFGNRFGGTTLYFNLKWRATTELNHRVTKADAMNQKTISVLCTVTVASANSQSFGYGDISITVNSTLRYKIVERNAADIYSRLLGNRSGLSYIGNAGMMRIASASGSTPWVKDVLIPA